MSPEEQINRLRDLVDKLINAQLTSQEQLGFLASVTRQTRQDVAGLSGKIDHLEQTLSEQIGEQDRKIDLILQHLTGLNNS
jgi:hypothetical protein